MTDLPIEMFKDETEEEFAARMVEVKKKWAQLDKQLPKEERFRREKIAKEAEHNLKEIPELLEWVDIKYGKPGKSFEKRFKKFTEEKEND